MDGIEPSSEPVIRKLATNLVQSILDGELKTEQKTQRPVRLVCSQTLPNQKGQRKLSG